MIANAAMDHATRGAEALERLRARAPRVHCLTNEAAANLTANGLLALGAVPSLTDHHEEIGAFTRSAGALAINLGTPDSGRLAAIDMAVAAAMGAGVPWVLDPVMIDRAPSRRAAARRLVAQGPDVLRLNEAERAALFDRPGAPDFSGVLAVSGETDRLSRGERRVEIANGHPLMARITGAGCLLGALTGAFLAVEPDPLEAAVAANLTLGIAGERAGARSTGPGSFQVAMLDALAALAPADIESQARIPCAL